MIPPPARRRRLWPRRALHRGASLGPAPPTEPRELIRQSLPLKGNGIGIVRWEAEAEGKLMPPAPASLTPGVAPGGAPLSEPSPPAPQDKEAVEENNAYTVRLQRLF